MELHGEYGRVTYGILGFDDACGGDGRGNVDLFRVAHIGVNLVTQLGGEAEERRREGVGKGARRVR